MLLFSLVVIHRVIASMQLDMNRYTFADSIYRMQVVALPRTLVRAVRGGP